MENVKLKKLSVIVLSLLVLLPELSSAHFRHRHVRRGHSRSASVGRDTQCFPATQPRMCLACNAYYESRNQPKKGQMAVNLVVMNRTELRNYPKSVCGVIYQRTGRRQTPQFSWTTERHNRNKEPGPWATALAVADATLQQGGGDQRFPADHFHATNVRPRWARNCARVATIGDHIFYNCYTNLNIASRRRGVFRTAAAVR